ncbi:hypothetical protein [Sandaracinobacter neustonicus]|nr:hypothetical protein [Sandaracinobacter neustonicus]
MQEVVWSNIGTSQAAAELGARMGFKVEDCKKTPDAKLSGFYGLGEPSHSAAAIRAAGGDAVWRDNVLKVRCNSAGQATSDKGAVQAVSSVAELPKDFDPKMASYYQGKVPPEDRAAGAATDLAPAADDNKISVYRSKNLETSRLVQLVSKLPGLSAMAAVDHPSEIVVFGPAKWHSEALKMLSQVDRCPPSVELLAIVAARANSDLAKRAFGLRLTGSTLFGGSLPTGGFTLDLGPVQAAVDALKQKDDALTLFSARGWAFEGQQVEIMDGSDVPVRTGTVTSDGVVTDSIEYRKIGHQLSVKIFGVSEGSITADVTLELSGLGATSDLGPSFNTRRTVSRIRVQSGEPVIVNLVGLDQSENRRSAGLFSVGRSRSASEAGGHLILTLWERACAPRAVAASESSQRAR